MSGKTHLCCRTRPASGALACAIAIGLLTLAGTVPLRAYDCPPERPLHLPPVEEPRDNIDKHKAQLRAYERGMEEDKGAYYDDVKQVLDDALIYVMSRADKVERPAVVLDIDETSLSNWGNIAADDFGFIGAGECPMQPHLACGFPAWVDRAEAEAIAPTLKFFNAVRAKGVAVFFITGRRNSQRRVTILNLRREGFQDWTELAMRPDNDASDTIVPFKSGERAKIENGEKPYDKAYHIIATIGDQTSDLIGNPDGKDKNDHAECPFKVPNPFYFIK
jgi:HAD superfamily, subfamily IIIB (Acid phosphatase)